MSVCGGAASMTMFLGNKNLQTTINTQLLYFIHTVDLYHSSKTDKI